MDANYYDIIRIKKGCISHEKENKRFFSKLRNSKLSKLDAVVHTLHHEVFEETDCLQCANCCKSISPIIRDKDIDRMSVYLKIKQACFIEKYLIKDDEGDWVFSEKPCPFLLDDNYCSIYKARPKACREYPHTDRRKFYQILPLTKKNMQVCPVVFEIISKLKKIDLDTLK